MSSDPICIPQGSSGFVPLGNDGFPALDVSHCHQDQDVVISEYISDLDLCINSRSDYWVKTICSAELPYQVGGLKDQAPMVVPPDGVPQCALQEAAAYPINKSLARY